MSRLLSHSRTLPRLAGITPEQFDELLGGGRGGFGQPFIATDAMDGWPCLETWSFAHLADRCGDLPVVTYASIDSRAQMRGPLAGYLEYLAQPPTQRPPTPPGFHWIDPDDGRRLERPSEPPDGPQYLVSWDLEEVNDLADDFPQPYFMGDRNLLDTLHPVTRRILFNKHHWIFVGPEGSLSQLHNDHDHVHTYCAQVVGEKHFVLISPADAHLVAEVDHLGHTRTGGSVDLLAPDLAFYPRFAEAETYECLLRPGELLFMPGSWLHFALGRTAGITVSRDSVDRHNFGRWFQSMAVDRLPKLMFRLSGHHVMDGFEHAPEWARRLAADRERRDAVARELQGETAL